MSLTCDFTGDMAQSCDVITSSPVGPAVEGPAGPVAPAVRDAAQHCCFIGPLRRPEKLERLVLANGP
jgi:hypothetical protein